MGKNKNVIFSERERRKPNRKAVLSVVIAAIIVFSFLFGFLVRGATEKDYARKINEIIKIIDDTSVYYDSETADETAYRFVRTLLSDDKYAAYYSPAEYRRILAEDKGNYSGVGVGFGKGADGTYDGTIGKVFLNSPAHKKGINVGDKLVAGIFKGQSDYTYFAGLADEHKVVLQVIADFFSEYDSGEAIKIKVLRGDEEKEFTVEKTDYVVSYVEYKDNEKAYCFSTEEDGFRGRATDADFIGELSPDTAYIRLHEFEGGAASQFGEAIGYMKSRGKTKLILDLRDNGGGLITVLSDILSYLINDNGANNIKIMEVKEKNARTSYSTSKNRFDPFLTDIAVIANCNTASASEALIGALYDYGNAAHKGAKFDLNRLVLTQKHETRQTYCTYGKGIMQTTYGLRSGGALVLTTAYIYWPLAKNAETNEPVCVQDKGIETANANNRVSDENAITRADQVLH